MAARNSGGGWTRDTAAAGSASPAFPVGAVFIAVVATNPATLLGYGTWSAIAAGRVLVGIDSGDTDFDTVEETGGAKTVASAGSNAAEAAHTHSVTSNVAVADHASHTHGVTADGDTTGILSGAQETVMIPPLFTTTSTGPSATLTHSVTNNAVTSGAGSSHNHAFTGSATSVVQPFLVVYMWKRTA